MIKKNQRSKANAIFVLALLVLLFVLEQVLPSSSMLMTVIKKSAIYALAAVSMNLLNGFTGLFSLGQAGFMLIGAYVYGISVAEDCGGDIKGDRMDLYFPTFDECIQFGRRVCTIYFLD